MTVILRQQSNQRTKIKVNIEVCQGPQKKKERNKLQRISKTEGDQIKLKLPTLKKGEAIGESFETHTGILQRDCLSTILFMLYFIFLIKPTKKKMKGHLVIAKIC